MLGMVREKKEGEGVRMIDKIEVKHAGYTIVYREWTNQWYVVEGETDLKASSSLSSAKEWIDSREKAGRSKAPFTKVLVLDTTTGTLVLVPGKTRTGIRKYGTIYCVVVKEDKSRKEVEIDRVFADSEHNQIMMGGLDSIARKIEALKIQARDMIQTLEKFDPAKLGLEVLEVIE